MSVRLFVGNLPYDSTESEIREFFAPVGRLSRVFLPVDRETGKQRGFAFIEFGTGSEADDAIRRMNDQPFKGRPIAVKEARERENRAPGGNGSYAGRSASPGSRPGPRPMGAPGGFQAPRATEEISAPQRRRSFGPAARPDRKRRPQLNRPHKSEWGKRAFKRERLQDDEDDDLNLLGIAADENEPELEPQPGDDEPNLEAQAEDEYESDVEEQDEDEEAERE